MNINSINNVKYPSEVFTEEQITKCANRIKQIPEILIPIMDDLETNNNDIIKKKFSYIKKWYATAFLPLIPSFLILYITKRSFTEKCAIKYCDDKEAEFFFTAMLTTTIAITAILYYFTYNNHFKPANEQWETCIGKIPQFIENQKKKLKSHNLDNLKLSLTSFDGYRKAFKCYNNPWTLRFASLEYLKQQSQIKDSQKLKSRLNENLFYFMTDKNTLRYIQKMTKSSGFKT